MNRRIVDKIEPQGYCGGVLKAISIAKETRKENPNQTITLLGNLVHNKYVKKALELERIKTIENKEKTRLQLLDELMKGLLFLLPMELLHKLKKKPFKKD